MGFHDGKFDIIQVNQLLSEEVEQIIAQNLLRYSEAFVLDDPLDIPYKSWVEDQIALNAQANTFVGFFPTLLDLQAVAIEEIPDGGYAFVGSDPNRQIYFWNETAEEWYNPFGITAIKTTVFTASAGASDVFTLDFEADGIIEVNVASTEKFPADYVLDGDELTVTHAFSGGESVKVVYFKNILVGQQGIPGINAYELAVEEGFVGTLEEWLESLNGADGTSVTILGSLNDESELPALGDPGDAYMIDGDLYVWSPTLADWDNVGPIRGPQGLPGLSAYQIWINLGNAGDESAFIADLKGTPGLSAYEVAVLNGYPGTEVEWLESLQGEDGSVDYAEADERYLRKDEDDATPYTISFGKIKLTDTGPDTEFTHILGYKADNSVVLINPSLVVGDKTLEMLVETPASVWVLNHGMGKKPCFNARDSSGNPRYPSWNHTSLNQLVLTHEDTISGDVVLN